jgi:hypothetical protein
MRRVFSQVTNRKAAKALIGLVVIGLIPAWIYVGKRLSPNANDAKLREVEELFVSIPTWPRSIELDVHRDSKAGLAGFSKSYKFDGGFDEVGQYYKETLMKRGRVYRGEHHVKDWWRDREDESFSSRRVNTSSQCSTLASSPIPNRYTVFHVDGKSECSLGVQSDPLPSQNGVPVVATGSTRNLDKIRVTFDHETRRRFTRK